MQRQVDNINTFSFTLFRNNYLLHYVPGIFNYSSFASNSTIIVVGIVRSVLQSSTFVVLVS